MSIQNIKEELKLLFASNSEKSKERIYILFIQLADFYLTSKKDHPKALSIYQYLKIQSKDHDDEIKRKEEILLNDFFSIHKNERNDIKWNDIINYKEKITNFRNDIKNRVSQLSDTSTLIQRSSLIKNYFQEIYEFFFGNEGIFIQLIQECLNVLPIPQIKRNDQLRNVQYLFFGMGSIALKTLTPWSDIEFGILIEEEITSEEKEKVKSYFRNLISLLHLKIISLGETPLRMMGIPELNNFKIIDTYDQEKNWFYDTLIKSGFSFDGPHSHACKTPLGRKGYKNLDDFELICTPNELIKLHDNDFYINNKHLIQALMQPVYLLGEKDLLKNYQEKVKQLRISKKRSLEILQEDINKYGIKLDKGFEEGKIYMVKKEIYRLTDRIIDGLAGIFQLASNDNWSRLEELYHKQIINSEAYTNLLISMSLASEIRFKIYSRYGGQEDELVIFNEKERQDLSLINRNFLFEFYYRVIPLTETIEDFIFEFSKGQKNTLINKNFFINNSLVKAKIHIRLLEYQKAKELLEPLYKKILEKIQPGTSLNFLDLCEDIRISNLYASILGHLGLYKEQAECFKKIKIFLDNIFYTFSTEEDNSQFKNNPYIKEYLNTFLAIILNNTGGSFLKQKNYKEAIELFQKAIKIYEINNNQISLAETLYNLSSIYLDYDCINPSKETREKAKENIDRSLDIFKRIDNHDLQSQVKIGIARCFKNLGCYYRFEKNYPLAEEYLLKAYNFYKKNYSNNHQDTLSILADLASLYLDKRNFGLAKEKIDEILTIFTNVLKNKNSFEYANYLHISANWLISLGYFKEAKEELFKERNILKSNQNAQGKDFIENTRELIRAIIRQKNKEFFEDESFGETSSKRYVEIYDEAIQLYNEVNITKGEIEPFNILFNLFDYIIELEFNNKENTNDNLLASIECCKVANLIFSQKFKGKLKIREEKLIEYAKRYYDNKNYTEAIKIYDYLIKLNTERQINNKIFFFNLARAHHNNGNLGKAIENYNKVLEIVPEHSKSINYLKECNLLLEIIKTFFEKKI